MSLLERQHWVFDLDGTLTVSTMDFASLRDALGLPRGVGVLEAVASMPDDERDRVIAAVTAWEEQHARRATAPRDVVPFLEALEDRGATMGILTRNTRRSALTTLGLCGIERFFPPRFVLGRGDAAPKPSPEGVEFLLREWAAEPADAVMVGDWHFDIEAGRAAGTATVLVDRAGRLDADTGADHHVAALTELLPAATHRG